MFIIPIIAAMLSATPADAAKRPLTYPSNPRLSSGPAENFIDLFIDPYQLPKLLKPLDAKDVDHVGPKARVTDDRIELNDRIFFAQRSSAIRPSTQQILDVVAKTMNRRPDIASVEIQGHIDRIGRPSLNLALSVRRAKAVVDYLITKGVNPARLTSIGFSSTDDSTDSAGIEFVIKRWSDVERLEPVIGVGAKTKMPAKRTKQSKKGSLLIENARLTWVEISVNGTPIGTMGPLTDAAIHGLRSGSYDVGFELPTGFAHHTTVATSVVQRPITPGGKEATQILPNRGLPPEEATVREAAE